MFYYKNDCDVCDRYKCKRKKNEKGMSNKTLGFFPLITRPTCYISSKIQLDTWHGIKKKDIRLEKNYERKMSEYSLTVIIHLMQERVRIFGLTLGQMVSPSKIFPFLCQSKKMYTFMTIIVPSKSLAKI